MSTFPAYGFGRPGVGIAAYGFGRVGRLTRELMKFAVSVFRQVVRDVER